MIVKVRRRIDLLPKERFVSGHCNAKVPNQRVVAGGGSMTCIGGSQS